MVDGPAVGSGVTGVPRRALYRRSKRLLSRMTGRTWRGPRSALEAAVRRFLHAKPSRFLARLVGDRSFALAAAASLAATGTAAALPPVNLADVAAGTGGFLISGIDPCDYSGSSVCGTGDVNGDGRYAGESYVVFSPACRFDCDGTDDGIVSVTDLLALLAQYDVMAPARCEGGSCDYNNDGCVDVVDLLKLLAHYDPAGLGCP